MLPARFFPKCVGDLERIDVAVHGAPPVDFLAGSMQLVVMYAAQRNGELIAGLDPAPLGELEMVGIAWRATADQARLGADVSEVLRIAVALWPLNQQSRLIGLRFCRRRDGGPRLSRWRLQRRGAYLR